MNNDAWERLSAFESHDLVKRLYERRHKLPLKSEKAKETTACLVQGRQFFDTAGVAGELARPLLLYYGVLSLARGLILFLDTKARLTTLSPAHGIEPRDWSGNLLAFGEGAIRIPSLQLMLNRSGTLGQLAHATRNRERWRVFAHTYPDEFRGQTGGTGVLASNPLTVDDILSRIPDLKPLYERTFDMDSQCYSSFVRATPLEFPSTIEVMELASGLVDLSSLSDFLQLPAGSLQEARRISDAGSRFVRGQETHNDVVQVTCVELHHPSLEELVDYFAMVKNDRLGNMFLVRPLADGTLLSTLSLYFLLAYVMGMLVRYYPTVWQSLIAREQGDIVFPLLKASLALIEDRFPSLVADELEDIHPKFLRAS